MGQHVTDVGLVKKEKKELKKHAATIHCSNTLSLLQRKITNALLYHAYQELMQKEEHEITVKQLCRLIGYQGNNHAVIKTALRGLISTIIEWNLIDDETGVENWTASSILASVSLEGPLCYYAYSPRMKQLLYTPSMFGKIDLVIQSKFRSSYGLALYENCTRYRDLPQTKWFDIELFKKLMGVPPGKYDVFRDFKRRVLDKAVDEVNMYSDLIITAEYIREGRKVVRVRFKLKARAKKSRLGRPLIVAGEGELKEKLARVFQLTPEQIDQLFLDYDTRFIQEKMTLVESSKSFQEGKVKNRAAYLHSAIKRNYQAVLTANIGEEGGSSKSRSSIPALVQDATFAFELAHLKQQIEIVRKDYQIYRDKVIYDAIQVLPEADKKNFMAAFQRYAGPVIHTTLQLQRGKYTRDNVLESPQVQALLRQFALRELDLLAICSFEEFMMQQEPEKVAAWQKLKSYDPDHPLVCR